MWPGGDGFSWPKEVPTDQLEPCLGSAVLGRIMEILKSAWLLNEVGAS